MIKIKSHYLALILAAVVGVIYIGPQLVFIYSLGNEYQGIPMLQTANEDTYLARIKEITDGHPAVAAFPYYEYKGQWPIAPPAGEMFYALPNLLFGMPLITVLIASKFILPFILFLLVYALVYNLLPAERLLARKISAIAGAWLVVLGYDLVDYHSWLGYLLRGEPLGGDFLLWSRPVNPILGAIFLSAFLLGVWAVIQKTKYRKTAIASAGLFFALMIMSYFFSWGIALSILGFLILLYIARRDYSVAKGLAYVAATAAVLSSPYWYMAYFSRQSAWYQDSILRSGLFYTHYPLLNKVLLATLGLYIVLIFVPLLINAARRAKIKLQDWQWFCLVLLLGSLWALNQQVITGVTIWPYHFVQYSIPLSLVVVIVLWHQFILPRWRFVWIFSVISFIGMSLLLGLYMQIHAYRSNYGYYRKLQSYAPVFEWFNDQSRDCVVLVNNPTRVYALTELLPAFTPCNVYDSYSVYLLMPNERVFHNIFTTLRLKGVTAENIDAYIKDNQPDLRIRFASNWQGIFGVTDFPDFRDPLLEQRMGQLAMNYKDFMKNDFRAELAKYRLDYILSVGSLSDIVKIQLPGIKLIKDINGIFIYQLQ